MRKGIFIPAVAVRITVGLLTAGVVAAMALSAPDAVRYLKMKSM